MCFAIPSVPRTELETRYSLFSRAGKFRVGIWADTYFSGSYSEALDLVARPRHSRGRACLRGSRRRRPPSTRISATHD